MVFPIFLTSVRPFAQVAEPHFFGANISSLRFLLILGTLITTSTVVIDRRIFYKFLMPFWGDFSSTSPTYESEGIRVGIGGYKALYPDIAPGRLSTIMFTSLSRNIL